MTKLNDPEGCKLSHYWQALNSSAVTARIKSLEAERDYWRDRALTADAELAELRETISQAKRILEANDNE